MCFRLNVLTQTPKPVTDDFKKSDPKPSRLMFLVVIYCRKKEVNDRVKNLLRSSVVRTLRSIRSIVDDQTRLSVRPVLFVERLRRANESSKIPLLQGLQKGGSGSRNSGLGVHAYPPSSDIKIRRDRDGLGPLHRLAATRPNRKMTRHYRK